VSGLYTGLHEPGSSHIEMLKSFIPEHLIEKGYQEARDKNYLGHEHGDGCLIWGTLKNTGI